MADQKATEPFCGDTPTHAPREIVNFGEIVHDIGPCWLRLGLVHDGNRVAAMGVDGEHQRTFPGCM